MGCIDGIDAGFGVKESQKLDEEPSGLQLLQPAAAAPAARPLTQREQQQLQQISDKMDAFLNKYSEAVSNG